MVDIYRLFEIQSSKTVDYFENQSYWLQRPTGRIQKNATTLKIKAIYLKIQSSLPQKSKLKSDKFSRVSETRIRCLPSRAKTRESSREGQDQAASLQYGPYATWFLSD
jgi:hypothetical protein